MRTIVFGVPPAALVGRGLAGVGRDPALARPARARDHLHAERVRRHRRLPPAVHAPELQDQAHRPRGAGGARLDGGRGPRDRVGLDPPQAPRPLRPSGRPAQPARRPGARVARCAARSRSRARRLDVPRQGHGQPGPVREGSARRPRPAVHQPHLPALGGGRAGAPVRPRIRPDRQPGGRVDRALVGRGRPGLPPASRHLQHQLPVPLLRPAAVRHRRRVAQPRLAGADRVRRGVAQQPPRVSHLRPARPRPPPGRPERVVDRGAGALPPGLGRDPHQPRAAAGKARIRSGRARGGGLGGTTRRCAATRGSRRSGPP